MTEMLSETPVSGADDAAFAVFVEEITARFQAGEDIDVEGYAREHPEHAERICQLLPAIQGLAGIGLSLSGEESGRPADKTTESFSGTLGDFRIVREVGRGGMGVVYEAEQISLKRQVALKVLPFAAVLDKKQLQRFKNEAQAAASLKHPNIVAIHSVGCERAVHFYAMDYIEGRTLAEVIDELRQDSRLAPEDEQAHRIGLNEKKSSSDDPTTQFKVTPQPDASPSADTDRQVQAHVSTEGSHRTPEFFRWMVRLGTQAAEALEHAHQMGVVHRDVKPSNLMIDTAGHLWVTDFGLAMTQTETNLTMTGDVLGTLRYMSPEQAEGKSPALDHRTDIYSLGVTLYELLTLKPAFGAGDRHKLVQEVFDGNLRLPRQVNPSIPRDLETIVLKAMATEPEGRYRTAQELADDLKRFLDNEPIRARRPSLVDRASKWAGRHKPVVWAAVAAVILAVVASTVGTVVVAQAYESERELRSEVEVQKERIEFQRVEAVAQRDRASRNAYLAEMRLVQQDWESGEIERLHDMLDRHLPRPGHPDFRGWEWHYLLARCHSDLLTLYGHRGYVAGVAWSPDGKRVASASLDGTVRIWDAAAGKHLVTLHGHGSCVFSVAWSPDGKRLASGGQYGKVILWDVNTGADVLRVRHGNGWIHSVAWSPDGTRLATANCSSSGQPVRVWDTATGRLLFALTRGPERTAGIAHSVDWSPNGERLAWADSGETVRVANAATGREVLSLREHTYGAYSVSWDPDSSLLALGFTDGRVKICGTVTGELLLDVDGHPDVVLSASWSPDGRRLATASRDPSIKIWDTANGQPILDLRGHGDRVSSVAWSPDGKRLASASMDLTVKVWDVAANGESRRLLRHSDEVERLAWSPNGKRIASASKDGTLKIWDTATRRETLELPYHAIQAEIGRKPRGAFAWSSDGRRIASASGEHTLAIADAETGEVFLTISGHSGCVDGMAWSPDGTRLASVDSGGTVKIWHAATGQEIREIPYPSGKNEYSCGSIAWSPDGRHIAAKGCWHVQVYEAANGKLVHSLPKRRRPYFNSMMQPPAWSGDARFVMAGDQQRVLIWEALSGRLVNVLRGHKAAVSFAAWSPDGKRIASTGPDETIKIWDAETAQEIVTLREHAGAHRCVAWSPDGRQLASASDDGTIRILDASRGYELAARPEFQVHRNLTHGRRLVAEGRLEQAIAFLEQTVADFPGVPEYHTELAYCQILAERGPNP